MVESVPVQQYSRLHWTILEQGNDPALLEVELVVKMNYWRLELHGPKLDEKTAGHA